MYYEDVDGSIAHVTMLAAQGIVTEEESKRIIERLHDTYERMDLCPLGAGALAGTTLPIDRHKTAALLDFAAPTENAMDSISDRDYSIEFLSDASVSMMHLSRWAEEFVWWNSQEFSFIDIDNSYCTGSSIMPQKKNPDMAEQRRQRPEDRLQRERNFWRV